MDEEGSNVQEWTTVILRRILFLGGPIAVYGVFLISMWFVYPPETSIFGRPSQEYLTLFFAFVVYLIPPFGKEFVIPAALALGYPIWIICFGIILMDMMSSILIALNFDLLEKIPFVGDLIRKFTEKASRIRKKKPWIEQLSYLGLLIFMYIPLQGSGATNATILGRLFGMRAQTMFWIITAGSIISTLSVVSCVTAVAKLWQISPRLAIFAILVIATAIIAVVLVWRKRTKRFSPEKPACSCGSNEEDIFS